MVVLDLNLVGGLHTDLVEVVDAGQELNPAAGRDFAEAGAGEKLAVGQDRLARRDESAARDKLRASSLRDDVAAAVQNARVGVHARGGIDVGMVVVCPAR